MFCLYTGIFGTLATRTSREYYVAVVGYLAAGLILISSAADGLIYSPNILGRVAASGFVLLSVLNVCMGLVLYVVVR
jgi:SHO1 osmosensor